MCNFLETFLKISKITTQIGCIVYNAYSAEKNNTFFLRKLNDKKEYIVFCNIYILLLCNTKNNDKT